MLKFEKNYKADKQSKTDPTKKSSLRKSKKNKKIDYALQQSTINYHDKSSKVYKKISKTDKKSKKKSPTELIKDYITRNTKKAIALSASFLILTGLVVGSPIVVKHFNLTGRTQIDKDCFKTSF